MADRKSKGTKHIQSQMGEPRDRVGSWATRSRPYVAGRSPRSSPGLFAEAEATREFKSLANNVAMAVLRELNTLARLPVHLRDTPAETWHATSEANASVQRDNAQLVELGPCPPIGEPVCCVQ